MSVLVLKYRYNENTMKLESGNQSCINMYEHETSLSALSGSVK